MIRNYNLIRSIVSEPWFLSVGEADKFRILLSGVFNPNLAIEPMTKEEIAGVSCIQPVRAGESQQIHNIGVVRIVGALTKYDTWCNYGMESYRRMIRGFKNDETISAIVLDIDSPGGTVVGTEELGDEIRNSNKPIIAFVSDTALSAGYWIASSCREIIANNTTAQIGSIGVLCTYMDLTEYYKKEGIEIHEILPFQSKDKREEENLIKAGKYTMTQERLGVLADKFHAFVCAGRPEVSKDQLTGKVYYAQDVVGSLVDSIGTFESTLIRAAELAEINPNNDNMSKKPFTNLAKAAGVKSFESADGSIHLTAEMAAMVEEALGDKDDEPEEVDDEVDTAETAAAKANSIYEDRIKALEVAIAEKDARIAELSKEPGAVGAAISPETDTTASDNKGADDFRGALAEAIDYLNS